MMTVLLQHETELLLSIGVFLSANRFFVIGVMTESGEQL